MQFNLSIVTPEKKIFIDQPVTSVVLKAYEGEMNILPQHAPLMSILKPGLLRFKKPGSSKWHSLKVGGGYCELNPKGVNVLADTVAE